MPGLFNIQTWIQAWIYFCVDILTYAIAQQVSVYFCKKKASHVFILIKT